MGGYQVQLGRGRGIEGPGATKLRRCSNIRSAASRWSSSRARRSVRNKAPSPPPLDSSPSDSDQSRRYRTSSAAFQQPTPNRRRRCLSCRSCRFCRHRRSFYGRRRSPTRQRATRSAGAPRNASSTNNASSALSETRGQSRRSRCSSARQCPSRQHRAITASEGSKSPEKSLATPRWTGARALARATKRHVVRTRPKHLGTLEPATSAARFTTSRSASGDDLPPHAARVDLKCASACAFNRLRRSGGTPRGRATDDDHGGRRENLVARPRTTAPSSWRSSSTPTLPLE